MDKKVRGHNVGHSNYAEMKIQPWDIILDHGLDFFDGSILKYLLRDKKTDTRKMDYEKIIHYCQERISQIDNPDNLVWHNPEINKNNAFDKNGFPNPNAVIGSYLYGKLGEHAKILDKSDVAEQEEEEIFDEEDESNFKMVPEPTHGNNCNGCYFKHNSFCSDDNWTGKCSEEDSIWIVKE